jgi:hypothetical protein
MFDTAGLVESARKAAGWDVQLASDDELLESARALEAARRAVDAASAHVAAALDGRGVTDVRFGHRAAQWLASELGLSRSEATRRVRVGRKLRVLDQVDDALVRGAISFEHARVIADAANPRIEQVVAGAQAELLALAGAMRFERWVTQVRGLMDLADQDGAHDPRPDRNHLRLTDGLDGVLGIEGALVGDLGVALRHAVEAEADRLFDRYRKDQETTGHTGDTDAPGRPRILAEALVDLVRRGVAASGGSLPAAEVTVIIPVDHPALGGTGDPRPVHDARGGTLPDAAVDLLCCDPVMRALVIDSLGVPLDMGTAVRFGTKDQRRAAAVRDGGCVFPGCDAPPAWTDLHHVIHVADGGATDIGNLASLCRRHHGVVHRRGWSMYTAADQWFGFTTPSGATLTSQRHGRQRQDE